MAANGTSSEERAEEIVERVFADYARRFQRYMPGERWVTEDEILDHLDRDHFLQRLVQELLNNRELYAALIRPHGEWVYKQQHLLGDEDREIVEQHGV